MHKSYRYIISITFLWYALMGSATAFGQQANVKASIDTNAILIGDHVTYTYEITIPARANLQAPLFADTLSRAIEMVSVSNLDTLSPADKNMKQFSQKLIITSFDSGTHFIPSLSFYYTMPGDTSRYTLVTQPISLYVNTIAVDTTQQIKDIKGPMKEPITWREILLIASGILLLAGIVVALIFIIRRLRQKKPIIALPTKPLVPPHDRALMAFEALRLEKLWQQGKEKEFHSQLTEILRSYIEEVYNFNCLDLTTSETLTEIKKHTTSAHNLQLLDKILSLSDLVKFAKYFPSGAEHEANITDAENYVKQTALQIGGEVDKFNHLKEVE